MENKSESQLEPVNKGEEPSKDENKPSEAEVDLVITDTVTIKKQEDDVNESGEPFEKIEDSLKENESSISSTNIDESNIQIITAEQTYQVLLPGGVSETLEANDEIQRMVDYVKPDVEQIIRDIGVITELKAISFRSQIVSGINYFIKAKLRETYVHLKVLKTIANNEDPMLLGVEFFKSADDPIEYFNLPEF